MNNFIKRKLRYCAVALLCISLMFTGMTPVLAHGGTAETSSERELLCILSIPEYFLTKEGQRLKGVFAEAIEDLQQSLADDEEHGLSEHITDSAMGRLSSVNLVIYRIVEMNDFAGNVYTLVELYPFGYMIYHNDSGTFVERSATAKSPFLGLYGDLYYGGFTNYFIRNEDENLKCVLSEYVVCAYIVADYWHEYSEEMANHFLEFSNWDVINYVKYGTMSVDAMSVASAASAWTWVSSSYFIVHQNLTNTAGYCMFVALAIVIGYADHRNRTLGIINTSASPRHVNNRGTTSALVQPALVTTLRNLGNTMGMGRFGITISQTRNLARRHLENRGVWNRFSYELRITALTATNARIRNQITASSPPILTGAGLPHIAKNARHGVVARGFRTEANGQLTVRTNYGWGPNWRDVWVTGFNWDGLLAFQVR